MSVINYSRKRRAYSRNQQGFTMMEVLVSVLVGSIGLVGIAGLQISSVNSSTVAYTNTQAVIALQEMTGLLHSSAPAARLGSYNIDPLTDGTLKSLSDLTALSTGATQADKDTYYWLQNLNAVLPSAKAAINCTSTGSCVIKVQFSNVDNSGLTAATTREQIVMVQL